MPTMSNYLMRMVVRAASAASGVRPRLPYQLGWRAAPQHDPSMSQALGFAGRASSAHSVEPGAFAWNGDNGPAERVTQERSMLPPSVHDRGWMTGRGAVDDAFFGASPDGEGGDPPTVDNKAGTHPGRTVFGDTDEPMADRSREGRTSKERPGSRFLEEAEILPDMLSSHVANSSQLPGTESLMRGIEDIATYSLQAEKATGLIVNELRTPPARPTSPPPITTRRPEAREAEPSVEVKIGRVEVTFENPPQPASRRPATPRGFDDYAGLRRYSPQAWNRWRG